MPPKGVGFSSLVMVLASVSALALPAGPAAAGPPPPPPPPRSLYTMVAFSNFSETHMDVYESDDGANFRPLRRPAYQPPFGLVRDPSIFRHRDGWYYVVYTTGWDGNTIGFARSRDRAHWEFVRYYPVPACCVGLPGTGSAAGPASHIPALNPLTGAIASGSAATGSGGAGSSLSPFVTHAWAPNWFIDGDRVNIIVSLSSGGDFVPHVMTALDPGLSLWSWPVPLAGIGVNHIDTAIVHDGPVYHAFTKNETTKFIEHAVGPTPTGPFHFVGAGNWAGWGSHREGPEVVRLDDGTWRIYMDSYGDRHYFFSDSHDGMRTWSPLHELPGTSGTVRHGSVIKEPR